MSETPPVRTVLVADDERLLADVFSQWLESKYEVRTAYDGESALELAGPEVDVALLDRRMPDLTGDEVLDELRSRKIECAVGMVTAVEPGFDVLEIGFDDYAVKPIDRDELHTLVSRLLEIRDVDSDMRDHFSKVSRLNTLDSSKPSDELRDNQEYARLSDETDRFSEELLSAAEEVVINSSSGAHSSSRQKSIRKDIQDWHHRASSVSEGDPLYQEAQNQIESLKEELRRGQSEAEKRLLDAVVEGYIAEDFWVAPIMQRALNVLLFDKVSDELVINRRPIADVADEGGTAKFDASQQIRDLANERREQTI